MKDWYAKSSDYSGFLISRIDWRKLGCLSLCVFMCSALSKVDVIAIDNERSLLTFTIENDVVENTDQHYTSGFRVAYLFGENKEPSWMKGLSNYFPFWKDTEVQRFELAFGQHIYTPADITILEPQPEDRPYAGWLFGTLGMVTKKDRVFDMFEMNFGVVGPSSFAEETQKYIHEWVGGDKAMGWEYQLEDQFTFQTTFQRNWWVIEGREFLGFEWDVLPHWGVSLGNVILYSNAGLTVSLRSGSPDSFGSPRVGLVLPGNGYFRVGNGFSWQVYFSVEGVAVGNNYFLDTKYPGMDTLSPVKSRSFVGEGQLGFQVVVKDFRISYTHIRRSREFDSQQKSEMYGALSVSYALK